MDIKIIDELTGKEVNKEEKQNSFSTPNIYPAGQLELQQMGELFDLKPSEVSTYKDKIQLLIDYAKVMSNDHSVENLKWAVRRLSNKVGTPPLGEKMINYLSKYAYLSVEKMRMEQMAKEMKKK